MKRRLQRWFLEDLWRIPLTILPRWKALGVGLIRIVIATGRHFTTNRNQLTASALTYYTLIAIVPVLAAIIGIGKGFGLAQLIETELLTRFPEQSEVLSWALQFAHSLLDNVRGGLLAGVSFLVVLWSVIKVLSHVEKAFNKIWNTSRGRSIPRRFTDYIAMIFVIPLFSLGASALTVLAHNNFIAGPILLLLPYLITYLLFTILYIFMPNSQVRWLPALFGGIVAGSAYQLIQWIYITFQIGVTTYGTIYGSFAALPLFFLWLHTSWLIVLAGAEVTYATQYVHLWEYHNDTKDISPRFEKLIAIVVTHYSMSKLQKGLGAVSASDVAQELSMPITLAKRVLQKLSKAQILAEVKVHESLNNRYLLALPTENLTLYTILEALENEGIEDFPCRKTKVFIAATKSLEVFSTTLKNSQKNPLLKDLC